MNPFIRNPMAYKRTGIRAERPEPKTGNGVASLRLYDPIDSWGGYWGVSAKEFVAALDELPEDTTEIRLLINSPGGEVWEGLAILNALRAHPAKVTAVVEGIAASAASFVATGVDELVMMPNAELMIHRAWGLCVGNANDMTKMSADLGHEDRNIAAIYAKKSGGTADEWLTAMSAETWYSGEEAVTAGLADRVESAADEDTETETAAESAKNRFDLSMFRARADRPAARAPKNPSPARAEADRKRGTRMSLNTDIAERLGLADDATDEDILAAVEKLATEPEPEPEPVETPAAPELPEGAVIVDRAALDALRNDAAAGRAARDRQEAEDRVRAVETAARDGRIAPSEREKWLNRINLDPREAEKLAKFEPVYPVGNEIGHGRSLDPTGSDTNAELGWFDTVTTTKKGA